MFTMVIAFVIIQTNAVGGVNIHMIGSMVVSFFMRQKWLNHFTVSLPQ
jgi:hypothetical protein